MIVNIRGTSGTGKSHVARQVMGLYTGGKWVFWQGGRKQPIGYVLGRPKGVGGPSLAVIGHYETACGGTDTISGYALIFELIRKAHASGYDVLYEGLLLSGDVKWTGSLLPLPLVVVGLDVPVSVCIDSINQRRWAKNPDKPPVNPANTLAKVRGTQLSMERLAKLGVRTVWATREEALNVIRGELNI